jgi:HEAT repeat protein
MTPSDTARQESDASFEQRSYELIQARSEAASTWLDLLASAGGGEDGDALAHSLSLVDQDTLAVLSDATTDMKTPELLVLNRAVFLRGLRGRVEMPEATTVHLVEMLEHPDPDVQASAAHALSVVVNSPERGLARALLGSLDRMPDDAVQSLVVTIARLDDTSSTSLWLLLDSPSRPVRVAAIREISRRAEGDEKLIGRLVLLANDEDREIRLEAARAIERLGSTAAPAVPTMVTWLNSPDVAHRRQAARTLGAIGPDAFQAVGSLVAALKDPAIADDASVALGRITPSSLPTLFELLDIESERLHAIRAVAAAGSKAITAGPRLEEWIDSKEPMRCEVAAALWQIGYRPRAALEVLINDCSNRYYSAVARPGPGAAPAVDLLTEALFLPELRSEATVALASIGAEAVPALAGALESEDSDVRSYACLALGRIGVPEESVANKIRQMLHDSDSGVRINAARAIVSADALDRSESTMVLAEALKVENEPTVQAAIIDLMGDLGVDPSTKAIIAAFLTHDVAEVRRAALRALVGVKVSSKLKGCEGDQRN